MSENEDYYYTWLRDNKNNYNELVLINNSKIENMNQIYVMVFVRYNNKLASDFKAYVSDINETIWSCVDTFTSIQIIPLLQYQSIRIDCIRHQLAFITEIQLIKPKQ